MAIHESFEVFQSRTLMQIGLWNFLFDNNLQFVLHVHSGSFPVYSDRVQHHRESMETLGFEGTQEGVG